MLLSSAYPWGRVMIVSQTFIWVMGICFTEQYFDDFGDLPDYFPFCNYKGLFLQCVHWLMKCSFHIIVVVSFIGGVNRRTWKKPINLSYVTDKLYHIILYTSPWSRFGLTTSVVIGTVCIGSCKSNYHTITATTALILELVLQFESNKCQIPSFSVTLTCPYYAFLLWWAIMLLSSAYPWGRVMIFSQTLIWVMGICFTEQYFDDFGDLPDYFPCCN
jgi:hypothetical protein